jgi:hypothetical protein
MPELALDDVERNAVASGLERMRVGSSCGAKAPSDPGAGCEPTELAANGAI